MRVCVLGSGSKGNATLVVSGATAVLIDGGFSGREIKRRLAAVGFDPSRLTAIMVTHEHTDHIRGVPVLSRQGKLPVFANSGTYQAAGRNLDNLADYQEFETGSSFNLQDLHIHPFSISHDTADPVGFVVSDDRFRLGYCTDTGMVSKLMLHRLGGCHGLVLECNHDPALLTSGPYPLFLKQRVRSNKGHLANQQAASCLAALVHDDLRYVALAHLSDTNNRPDIAVAVVTEALEALPLPLRHLTVVVASQDQPGDLVRL